MKTNTVNTVPKIPILLITEVPPKKPMDLVVEQPTNAESLLTGHALSISSVISGTLACKIQWQPGLLIGIDV
jgi:hypothetical protein